jgi:hypothetical protein
VAVRLARAPGVGHDRHVPFAASKVLCVLLFSASAPADAPPPGLPPSECSPPAQDVAPGVSPFDDEDPEEAPAADDPERDAPPDGKEARSSRDATGAAKRESPRARATAVPAREP